MKSRLAVSVIYEDESILVVNKPAGALVHPAPGHEGEPCLTEFLLRHSPQSEKVGSVERPGVVHRLDQWTSGVLVMAKQQEAYLDLRRQFERHDTVEKTYLAVCRGIPKPLSGTIDSPIDGHAAVSHYRVLGKHAGRSLVEFKIETGRTHQIRIHAALLGCPILGDRSGGRVLLHAVELAFNHPQTHKRVTFVAPPPNDIVYA